MIRRTQAIILDRQPFSNTSLILVCASPEHGRLRLLAKGVRWPPKKRFARPPELFSRGELLYYPRRAEALAILAEWSEEEPRRGLGEAPPGAPGALELAAQRLAAAHAAAELAARALQEESPEPGLFSALDRALDELARAYSGEAVAGALARFELSVLAALGALPELDRCSACGRELAAGEAGWLLPGSGGPSSAGAGLFCAACRAAPPEPGGPDPVRPLRLSAPALALARLLARPGEGFPLERLRAQPGALRALAAALLAALETFLERRLRSRRRLAAAGLAPAARTG